METHKNLQNQKPQYVQDYDDKKTCKIYLESSKLWSLFLYNCCTAKIPFFFFYTSVKSNSSTFIVIRLLKCILFHSLNNCLAFWNHHPVWWDLLIKQTNFSLWKTTCFQVVLPLVLMMIVLYMTAGLLKGSDFNSELKRTHDSALVKLFLQNQSASRVLSKILHLSHSTCTKRL